MAKKKGLTGETKTKTTAGGDAPKQHGKIEQFACRHCGVTFWGHKDAKVCGRSPCYEREYWDDRQWLGQAFIAVRNAELGKAPTEMETEALRRVRMTPEQIVEAWRGSWLTYRKEPECSASSPSPTSSTPLASGF